MGVIFLISSSGYVLYTSTCSCTGEEQTSFFLKPEPCETSFHQHHEHDLSGNEIACSSVECHDCQDHTKSCGCDSPEVFFFKLEDKATNEEIKFVTPEILSVEVFVAVLSAFQLSELTIDNDGVTYCDPPLQSYSSLDFLIRIQQLKIPSVA